MTSYPTATKTKIKTSTKVGLIFFGIAAIAAAVIVLVPKKTLSITNMNPLIAPGGLVTLNWTATNVASCTASALPASSAWTGGKSLSGSQTILSVTADTKYTLVCAGTDGTTITKTSAPAVVALSAPVITISANPNPVVSGQNSTLSWTVQYANTCTPSDAWSGSGNKSVPIGSYVIFALTTPKTYTLSCTGPLGTTQKSITVNVGGGTLSIIQPTPPLTSPLDLLPTSPPTTPPPATPPTPPPSTPPTTATVIFTASPTSVAPGSSVTLSWNATKVTSCAASASPYSGSWNGSKTYSGSQTISSLTINTTYTLTCLGFDGTSIKQSVSVSVDTAIPSIPPMASSPSSVKNVLSILWDPHRPDHPAPSKSSVENLISGATGSLVDYYRNQSGGKVEIRIAGALGWYDADKLADHYWNHPVDANDGFTSGHVEKWAEAIRKADLDFNFSTYDTNGDGILATDELGILIVIPQNSTFGTVRDVFAQETPISKSLIVDGVAIRQISEVYMGATTNFGVFAHEEGHLLFKFPDMYEAMPPAGKYSLMDAGYSNVQLDPYQKYWQGWLTAREITTDGYYSVNDVQNYREVLKITKPGDPKEFFLIENRQRGSYDINILDTGIVVWNIYDERTGDWGRDNIRIINPTGADSAWHGPGGTNGYDLKLKWRDGSDSRIIIKEFPDSSANMRIFIDMP